MNTSRRTATILATTAALLIPGIMSSALQNPAPASAADTGCQAAAVIADAADLPQGLTVTVTLTGDCPEVALVLAGVALSGAVTDLTTRDFVATRAGRSVAQVTFVPDNATYAYYRLSVPGLLSTNVAV